VPQEEVVPQGVVPREEVVSREEIIPREEIVPREEVVSREKITPREEDNSWVEKRSPWASLLVPFVSEPRLPGERPISAGAVVTKRFTVLVRDGVAEEIRVLTGGETVDEITPLTGDEKNKASSVMEGADDEISPLAGDETNIKRPPWWRELTKK
jgi:hypothetical protein